jgi:uncharacterized surface protein with fasciclin (FAS1) repeats
MGDEAYKGDTGQTRANKNLNRFVSSHVVPKSPWRPGDKGVKTLQGGEVSVEEKDGKWYIQPGNVEVLRLAESVNNGEVWVLKETLNYKR